MDPELRRSLDELIATNRRLIQLQSYWRLFLRGAVSGIGAAIGATLVIAIIAALLHQLSSISVLRPLVQPIIPYVERQSDRLIPDTTPDLPSPEYVEVPEATPTVDPTPTVSPTPTEE